MSHPGLLLDERSDTTQLSAVPHLSTDEAAGLTAALASTIAHLHDLGVQLGGFDSADVFLDAGGRPLVRVTELTHHDEADARSADVRSLGHVLSGLLPDRPSGPGAADSRRGTS